MHSQRIILTFVTFHLKQVGLDNKMLNGGIVLTGGGSQMKHLIQLTEYVTGLNARIGYPNEHLAGNHIEGMEKPMYATCIGLILKGYSVYEGSLNELKSENKINEKTKKLIQDFLDKMANNDEPFFDNETKYDNFKSYKTNNIKILLYNNHDRITKDIALLIGDDVEPKVENVMV